MEASARAASATEGRRGDRRQEKRSGGVRDSLLSGSEAVFCLSLFKGDVGGFEDTRGIAGVAPGEEIGGVRVIVLFKEEDGGDGARGVAAVA